MNQSKENGGAEDEDDFSALDDIPDMEGNDMNDIMNDILMNKEEEGEGRAAARNHHMNSFFDAPLGLLFLANPKSIAKLFLKYY